MATNKYPGTCSKCGGRVAPGEGTIRKVEDYEGKHIVIGDFDAKTYDTLHVVFNQE